MKKDLERRLENVETKGTDWISKLKEIDYLNGLDNYPEGEWQRVFGDDFVIVIRSRTSGEIKGVYADRRTDADIVAAGGDLRYV